MSRPKTSEYTILGDALHTPNFHSRLKYAALLRHLIAMFIFILIVGVAFTAGRYSAGTPEVNISRKSHKSMLDYQRSNIGLIVKSIDHTFVYNRTFAEGGQRAARAWRELFPPENGYFTHPEVAPERSTLSVYHTLHCLVRPNSKFLFMYTHIFLEWNSRRLLESP
jgi:hypothetical protein